MAMDILAKGKLLRWVERPLIMGVVNVTPDSFSDGGRYLDPAAALAHACRLVEEGADILDIGAESTRPGSCPVSEDEEIRRLLPVVTAVARSVSVPISVDTSKSHVAKVALDAGAGMVNDVTALRGDKDMADVIAETGASVVLMHMQGTPGTMQRAPHYAHVVEEVSSFLAERARVALDRGIGKNQIVLDPGIGFGKVLVHNLELLGQLRTLTKLGYPVLVGPSRKAFIGQIIDRPVEERAWGTAAAVAVAVMQGAGILRVHDVAAMRDVVKVAAAISNYLPSMREQHA